MVVDDFEHSVFSSPTGVRPMARMMAILIMLIASVATGGDAGDKLATPAEQYKALVKDFHQAVNLFLFNATTDEERAKHVARAIKLPPQLLALCEKHPHEAF